MNVEGQVTGDKRAHDDVPPAARRADQLRDAAQDAAGHQAKGGGGWTLKTDLGAQMH